MECAGLIFDDSRHYIDHLAPFCALMKWPLIICEPEVADLARRYYPDLLVQEVPFRDLELPDVLVSCDCRALIQAAFGRCPSTFLWLPHGHSDKGWRISIFDTLDKEIPLVYGETMYRRLQDKNPIRIGNFRYHYFAKHRSFYETLTPTNPFTLYAPTWDDLEGNSSFWKTLPTLAMQKSLVVKIHPNTQRKFAAELEVLLGKYPNIHFLFDFPPVYPLLEHATAYIGDMSSIGYDFLLYNRPMFFFPSRSLDLPLFRCGSLGFCPSQEFTAQRKELYAQTFDPINTWQQVAQQIYNRL